MVGHLRTVLTSTVEFVAVIETIIHKVAAVCQVPTDPLLVQFAAGHGSVKRQQYAHTSDLTSN